MPDVTEKPLRSKEEDEEVVPTQSKMPSVDELII